MKNLIKQNPFVAQNNDQIQIEKIDLYNSLRKEWKIKAVTKIKKSKKYIIEKN